MEISNRSWAIKYNIHKRPDKPYIRTMAVVNSPKGVGIVTYRKHRSTDDDHKETLISVAIPSGNRNVAYIYKFNLEKIDLVDMEIDHQSEWRKVAFIHVYEDAQAENGQYEFDRAYAELNEWFSWDLPNTEYMVDEDNDHCVELISKYGLFDYQFNLKYPFAGDSDIYAEIVQLANGYHKEPCFTTKVGKLGRGWAITTRMIDWEDLGAEMNNDDRRQQDKETGHRLQAW